MKKIFILAYAKANVGDDLFIQMLLEKYKDVQFYINIKEKEHQKAFENYRNITIISDKERDLTPENSKEFDGYIYIGGSIFMEGGVVYNITDDFLEFLKACKKNKIPFYYVSSNFGPYYTQEYLDLARKVYNEIEDICFRDKYSYELFSDIKSVRYAPDLAFSYTPENIEQIPDTVGISMIDFDIRKDLKDKKAKYFELMRNTIRDCIGSNRKVYLFSFCEYEGDEKAIEELLATIPDEYKDKINTVLYRGNMREFLNIYSKMEYMICARFHAMVLSTVFEQKQYVVSYSDKINNVVDDLDLNLNILDLRKFKDSSKIDFELFKKVDHKKVVEIAGKAKKQLEKVNEFGKEEEICI